MEPQPRVRHRPTGSSPRRGARRDPRLGLVVLRARSSLAEWVPPFPGAPDTIAVNVAVQQFDSPDLLADVTQVLRSRRRPEPDRARVTEAR
jgi:hypothetical protein